MTDDNTVREVHPVLLFNRPDLSVRAHRDFRPVPVSVQDELPPRPVAPTLAAVEVIDPKKSSSSATSNVSQSGIDSGETGTMTPQTPMPEPNGANPASVEKDSPDLIRPPLQ